MTDNQSNLSYQDILDKYAESISSKDDHQIPEEKIKPEPELEPVNPPEPILTPEEEEMVKSQPEPQSELESQASPQIEAPPAPEAINPPPVTEAIIPPIVPPKLTNESGSIPPSLPPKKQNHFFKYLFFFSLIIFIIVLVLVVISFLNSQKPITDSQELPPNNIPTSIPTAFCELNDQKYSIGQTFSATDGCNTCTCGEDLTISCTEKTCDLTPTQSATVSASPSASTLRSQVEDWKTYTKSSTNLSWGKCGDSEIEISKTIKDTISKETAYFKEIDNYKIYYTPKLNFTAEDLKKFEICAVGDNTPRKIIGDKILWADGCGGISDETSEKCDNIMKQVEMLYKL